MACEINIFLLTIDGNKTLVYKLFKLLWKGIVKTTRYYSICVDNASGRQNEIKSFLVETIHINYTTSLSSVL